MRKLSEVNVLIVDDEAALRQALVFDFKRKGFNVLDAENGRIAFDLVKNNKIDIVLTDVRMPDGDGVELLERVREYHPSAPVVMFITGFADLTLEDAYDKGADAVFSKPFDRKSLMGTVMKALVSKEELWGGRQSERLEVEFSIHVKFPELNHAVNAKVLNIGRGGMFIALKDKFPEVLSRAEFKIEFEAGVLKCIEGDGIVRWIRTQVSESRSTGCGIEFETLKDNCRPDLIQLLNDLKTKAFIPKN